MSPILILRLLAAAITISARILVFLAMEDVDLHIDESTRFPLPLDGPSCGDHASTRSGSVVGQICTLVADATSLGKTVQITYSGVYGSLLDELHSSPCYLHSRQFVLHHHVH